MGGMGSGRRHQGRRKMTVEDCRSLSVSKLSRDGLLEPGTAVRLYFSDSFRGHRYASVRLTVPRKEGHQTMIVNDEWNGAGNSVRIRLEKTQPNFGGHRWWFTCPMVVDGSPCDRRCCKLLFRGRNLGCRQCLDLAYWSSQNSGARRVMKRIRERVHQKVDFGHEVNPQATVLRKVGIVLP
jgi:hypothetical protein